MTNRRCSKCGNESERVFRVTSHEGTVWTFDSFECAISTLAPRCGRCGSTILGHPLVRGSVCFCCDHCARGAASDAVDEASDESFPASDPPAPPPSAVAAVARGRLRRQEGRIGWILLWLLGVPIPVLLLLYFVRGCT